LIASVSLFPVDRLLSLVFDPNRTLIGPRFRILPGAGAAIGGAAGGGKGAAIGALVGAGAGTARAYLTGKREIVLPAETRGPRSDH